MNAKYATNGWNPNITTDATVSENIMQAQINDTQILIISIIFIPFKD